VQEKNYLAFAPVGKSRVGYKVIDSAQSERTHTWTNALKLRTVGWLALMFGSKVSQFHYGQFDLDVYSFGANTEPSNPDNAQA
jgi:hypothetical protein